MQTFGNHGDVLVIPVKSAKGLVLGDPMLPDESKALTVVRGEQTGHHHQFREVNKVNIRPILEGNPEMVDRYLVEVKEDTVLQHFNVNTNLPTKEHADRAFPAGMYIVHTQRQINHNREVQRAVD